MAKKKEKKPQYDWFRKNPRVEHWLARNKNREPFKSNPHLLYGHARKMYNKWKADGSLRSRNMQYSRKKNRLGKSIGQKTLSIQEGRRWNLTKAVVRRIAKDTMDGFATGINQAASGPTPEPFVYPITHGASGLAKGVRNAYRIIKQSGKKSGKNPTHEVKSAGKINGFRDFASGQKSGKKRTVEERNEARMAKLKRMEKRKEKDKEFLAKFNRRQKKLRDIASKTRPW